MSVSKLKPLAKPTPKDLDLRLIEVHGCVHNVGRDVKKVAAEGRKREKAIKGEIDGVKSEVDLLKRIVLGTAVTLGSPIPAEAAKMASDTPRGHRRFGAMPAWKVWVAIFSSVGGALTLFKIGDALLTPWLPGAWTFIRQVLLHTN